MDEPVGSNPPRIPFPEFPELTPCRLHVLFIRRRVFDVMSPPRGLMVVFMGTD